MTTKEEFLEKHNSLVSADMKVTMEILDCFELEKPALFKGGDYSIDKIRRPFIFWLTSLTNSEKKEMAKLK